jgi:hypothetical protein
LELGELFFKEAVSLNGIQVEIGENGMKGGAGLKRCKEIVHPGELTFPMVHVKPSGQLQGAKAFHRQGATRLPCRTGLCGKARLLLFQGILPEEVAQPRLGRQEIRRLSEEESTFSLPPFDLPEEPELQSLAFLSALEIIEIQVLRKAGGSCLL